MERGFWISDAESQPDELAQIVGCCSWKQILTLKPVRLPLDKKLFTVLIKTILRSDCLKN
jgi:hypothetical protein